MTDRASSPPITVSGGPAPTAFPDVLDAGPEPGDRVPRRRRVLAALTGVGVLLTLGAADQVRDRQAEAEAARGQEQREAADVDLVLVGEWSGSSSYERATGHLTYRVDMTVRNDGPRAVQLLGVGLPGVQVGAPIVLDAGRARPLSLQGSYACGAREPAPFTVPFEVRTDAGPRYVDLPIPPGMFDTDPLADACDEARAGAGGVPPPGPDAAA